MIVPSPMLPCGQDLCLLTCLGPPCLSRQPAAVLKFCHFGLSTSPDAFYVMTLKKHVFTGYLSSVAVKSLSLFRNGGGEEDRKDEYWLAKGRICVDRVAKGGGAFVKHIKVIRYDLMSLTQGFPFNEPSSAKCECVG
ncbi:hypothetical protein RRG08_055979 [Elysia crispata]|uniref:Uncharacterized protein n=1 Tax=Elysia crispata TaxID=231223 RepID=A0AAE1AIA6_9GAST|nr:hypothetical protein RRG08_055979 [Elysia crispata]